MVGISDRIPALLARAHAHRAYRRFVRAARNAERTQKQVLAEILASAKSSRFGREHGLREVRSAREFAARVPVRSYEEIRPYIDRVMAGQLDALFDGGTQVLMFAMTSGSTDRPKYVPITPRFLRAYRRGWHVFGGKALLDHPEAFLRPILQTVSPMDEQRTALNVPCGAISGLLAATQKKIVRKYYTSPAAAGWIEDCEARYYTIMRFGLARDVSWLVTANPATQIKLAASAAANSERLIRDIHDGTLRAPGEIPPGVQAVLVKRLRPDRAAAGRLESVVHRKGVLLPKDYWRLSFLANWTGGTLGLHLRDFPKYFGDTPVRDIGLLATEGRVTIPLQDGTPGGVLDVPGSFFEFAEVGSSQTDSNSLLLCHELEIGGEYRVILTNFAGLYRYDLGDHVRVLGHFGTAPILEFLHRGAYTCSLSGEKLTEWQVTSAFRKAAAALNIPAATTFVLAPVWDEPPFYRLHVERSLFSVRELAIEIDRALTQLNVEYAGKRASGRLGAILLNLLEPGRLEQLNTDRQQRRGPANEQYKHQYLYQRPGDDDCLMNPTGFRFGMAPSEFGSRIRPANKDTQHEQCDGPERDLWTSSGHSARNTN